MQTYKYNSETKEFLYAEEVFLDPLETEIQGKKIYLLPADSTFTEPLEAKDGYAVCWNGEVWEYKEDYRGKEYWLPADDWRSSPREMKELGALPEGAITERPRKPFDVAIADAKAALKAHRQFIEHGGVVINGQRWDTDVKDEVRLLEQAVFAATGELQPIEWKVADGVYITLTTEVLSEAVAAFKRHFERCFEIEQQKLVELEGLTSEEEILAWQKGPMLEGWD